MLLQKKEVLELNVAKKGCTQPWLYAGMDVGAGFTFLSVRCGENILLKVYQRSLLSEKKMVTEATTS